MINWDKINKKISVKKLILPVMLVILIFMFIVWGRILFKHIQKNKFVGDMEKIITKNENPEFSIEKIYLCSSANAIDNTEEQKLDHLGIYQYTDIAIYINNHKEDILTDKNTVKQLFIDDIEIDLDYNIGKTSLVYTNLLKIGSRDELSQMVRMNKNKPAERIDFNVLTTNDQNSAADYSEPTFYADCSNPISLKYINEISTEYAVSKNSSTVFDGSILKKVGIKTEDINAKIKFRINLVNNKNEYYSNYVNFRIPLYDIDKGVSIKSKTTVGSEYDFFTI